jgi:sugar lactone lactonase YvrE
VAFDTLAHGFTLTEAPCADAEGNVYFSDVLNGGVQCWSEREGVVTVVPKRRGIGGMVLHADGGLVVSGRDVSHARGDETRTLLSAPEGVTGFNDIAADAAGRVYAGALRFMPFAGEQVVPGEFWRIDAEGSAVLLFGGVEWPNGVGLSPDGETVYACDYASGELLAHPAAQTDAGRPRVLARSPAGSLDGLALDERGGIWVALGQGGGIARFEPDGTLDHVLDVPASFVSSCCFGGPDMRDLYITTADNTDDPARGGTLFRTRVEVAGLPVPMASI